MVKHVWLPKTHCNAERKKWQHVSKGQNSNTAGLCKDKKNEASKTIERSIERVKSNAFQRNTVWCYVFLKEMCFIKYIYNNLLLGSSNNDIYYTFIHTSQSRAFILSNDCDIVIFTSIMLCFKYHIRYQSLYSTWTL